uniref:Chromo domain-containing protein n=1 Tax=Strongyloides stercoralis TaxID=6248 RepID=A0A0K0ELT1_STRER
MDIKIVGKIELIKDNDGKLNTYYLVQWSNNESEPITIQTRSSLIDYEDKIAQFEAKSTVNHFSYKNNTNLLHNEISNIEARKLIDILKKYDQHQNNTSIDKSQKNNIKKNLNVEVESSSSETNYNNKKENNIIQPIILNDDTSSLEIEDFTEKYANSPDSYNDFSDIGTPITIDNSHDWQIKWWNLIMEDENKSEKKRNWETLKIISEIVQNSVHYYIGYDIETKYMSLIEDHEIPDFKKSEIDTLKKFQKR